MRMRIIGTVISMLLIIYLILIVMLTNFDNKDQTDFSEYENGSLIKPDIELSTQELTELEYGLEVGQEAPDFQLENLNGETVRLGDFKGKTIVLNFWATWCPPCREEMPEMQAFYNGDGKDEAEILAINATNLERSIDHTRDFVDEYQLTFPVLLDQEGEIVDLYQVRFFPTTYIVDAEGVITEKISYPINEEIIKEAIQTR